MAFRQPTAHNEEMFAISEQIIASVLEVKLIS
jgi:hypothetical protein